MDDSSPSETSPSQVSSEDEDDDDESAQSSSEKEMDGLDVSSSLEDRYIHRDSHHEDHQDDEKIRQLIEKHQLAQDKLHE